MRRAALKPTRLKLPVLPAAPLSVTLRGTDPGAGPGTAFMSGPDVSRRLVKQRLLEMIPELHIFLGEQAWPALLHA